MHEKKITIFYDTLSTVLGYDPELLSSFKEFSTYDSDIQFPITPDTLARFSLPQGETFMSDKVIYKLNMAKCCYCDDPINESDVPVTHCGNGVFYHDCFLKSLSAQSQSYVLLTTEENKNFDRTCPMCKQKLNNKEIIKIYGITNERRKMINELREKKRERHKVRKDTHVKEREKEILRTVVNRNVRLSCGHEAMTNSLVDLASGIITYNSHAGNTFLNINSLIEEVTIFKCQTCLKPQGIEDSYRCFGKSQMDAFLTNYCGRCVKPLYRGIEKDRGGHFICKRCEPAKDTKPCVFCQHAIIEEEPNWWTSKTAYFIYTGFGVVIIVVIIIVLWLVIGRK